MGFFDRGGDDADPPETTDGPTFGDKWDVSPASDQQWEYRVVAASAIRGAATDGGQYASVDEVLDEFGKDGWELVETVEGLRLADSSSADGTVELLFKRPATYARRDEADGSGGADQ